MSKSGLNLLQIMKDIAQVSPDTQDLNYSYNEDRGDNNKYIIR